MSPVCTEAFGPGALTDNRGNDSGSPWEWSFWLGENGKDASFTLDLQTASNFSKIELQNTRNRQHRDRETRQFRIETSIDGNDFNLLLEGELASVIDLEGNQFPFESFDFKSTKARYVKFTAFASTDKNMDGVGLNEIRIFE